MDSTNRNPLALAMGRFKKLLLLLLLALSGLAGMARADWAGNLTVQAPQSVPCFTNAYSIWGTNLLNMLPATNQGIYYQGETVTISNSVATPIEVYDFRSKPITKGPSPLSITNLPVGHYWVQCSGTAANKFGDRSQFSILPAHWHPMSYIGTTYTDGLVDGAEYRVQRIKPTFVRGSGAVWWDTINVAPGSNDWTAMDAVLGLYTNGGFYANLGVKRVWTFTWCPTWVMPQQTNTVNGKTIITYLPTTLYSTNWDAFRTVYTNFCAQVADRYGTNFIIELFNEPYEDALWQHPTNNWPTGSSTNWEQQLAMTIGAAVDAIHAVSRAKYGSTTNIEIWAPAWQSLDGRMSQVTNPVTKAYYNKVDAIAWHDGTIYAGPVDDATIYHPEAWNSAQYIENAFQAVKRVTDAFPNHKFYIDEVLEGSSCADVLGRTNEFRYNPLATHDPPDPTTYLTTWINRPIATHTNTWKDYQNRFIKQNVLWKQAGITGVKLENFATCCNTDHAPPNPDGTGGYSDWVGWYGWTESQPVPGHPKQGGRIAGPNPTHDAFMMTAYWLDGFGPKTNYWKDVVFRAAFTNSAGSERDFYWTREATTTNRFLATTANGVMDVYGASASKTNLTEEPMIVDVSAPVGHRQHKSR